MSDPDTLVFKPFHWLHLTQSKHYNSQGPARALIIAHDLAHPAIQLPVRNLPCCSSTTLGSSCPEACTLDAPKAQSALS